MKSKICWLSLMILNSFLELPVEVEFDFHPGCPEKRWGENVHPEEPAEIEITKISYNGIEIDDVGDLMLGVYVREAWDQLKAEADENNQAFRTGQL